MSNCIFCAFCCSVAIPSLIFGSKNRIQTPAFFICKRTLQTLCSGFCFHHTRKESNCQHFYLQVVISRSNSFLGIFLSSLNNEKVCSSKKRSLGQIVLRLIKIPFIKIECQAYSPWHPSFVL